MGALIFCASLLLVLVSQLRWRWPMTQSQSLFFSWLARQQGCPCAGGTSHIFAPHPTYHMDQLEFGQFIKGGESSIEEGRKSIVESALGI